MAEFTAKTIQYIGNTPGAGIDVAYVAGVSAVNNDTFTVSGLTTVKGAFLISTTGTVGAMTFSTNVITVTNGSTLTWTGLAWGVP
jgi:hypothetical protein